MKERIHRTTLLDKIELTRDSPLFPVWLFVFLVVISTLLSSILT